MTQQDPNDAIKTPGASVQVGRVRVEFLNAVNQSTMDQARVLLEALCVYDHRNAMYKDNWAKSGWRGGLFKLRLKVERAWDVLWNEDPVLEGEKIHDIDDLLDAINCAGMTIRAVRKNDRDGTWW